MRYYRARTEEGGSAEDPSEDVLYELLSGLSYPDNRFLTVRPAASETRWSVRISLVDEGRPRRYRIEYLDPEQGEHQVITESSPSRIAENTSLWLTSTLLCHGQD